MSDFAPSMPLNPGIRATVAFLRAHSFDTCDSGDGATHDAECDREYAYVVSKVDPAQIVSESDRLVALLASVGVVVLPQSMENTPCIQATYDPATGTAYVDLMYVDDALLTASAADAFMEYAAAHGLRPTGRG